MDLMIPVLIGVVYISCFIFWTCKHYILIPETEVSPLADFEKKNITDGSQIEISIVGKLYSFNLLSNSCQLSTQMWPEPRSSLAKQTWPWQQEDLTSSASRKQSLISC